MLYDCAAEFACPALSRLADSILQVEDEGIRRRHTLLLIDTLLEYRENLWQPDLRWRLVSDFVRLTWLHKNDIAVYSGHLSEECHLLLARARDILARAANQIDSCLANPKDVD